jgi:hypothetical protein
LSQSRLHADTTPACRTTTTHPSGCCAAVPRSQSTLRDPFQAAQGLNRRRRTNEVIALASLHAHAWPRFGMTCSDCWRGKFFDAFCCKSATRCNGKPRTLHSESCNHQLLTFQMSSTFSIPLPRTSLSSHPKPQRTTSGLFLKTLLVRPRTSHSHSNTASSTQNLVTSVCSRFVAVQHGRFGRVVSLLLTAALGGNIDTTAHHGRGCLGIDCSV